MHELAVCQALLTEVQRAAGRAPGAVTRVVIRVGALSGVEPRLLERAFSVARAGSIAADAELVVEIAPVEVECLECHAVSPATPNHLVCARCGGWRTRLASGDELVLQRLELRGIPAPAERSALPEPSHV